MNDQTYNQLCFNCKLKTLATIFVICTQGSSSSVGHGSAGAVLEVSLRRLHALHGGGGGGGGVGSGGGVDAVGMQGRLILQRIMQYVI